MSKSKEIEEHFKVDADNAAAKAVFNNEENDAFLGVRHKGFYETDDTYEGVAVTRYIFDNGHVYYYDDDNDEFVYESKVSADLFLHRYIEVILLNFIKANGLTQGEARLPMYCEMEEVECRSLIRLCIDREHRIVSLSNILIPMRLQNQGLGTGLIKQIYTLCHYLGYRLVLVQMVESFYKRMVARGATVIDFETVEINDHTKL